MEKASMDEVKAAVEESQDLPATPEETSTSQEVTPEETQEVAQPPVEPKVEPEVSQGVPQARVDQIVAEREAVKAEKQALEAQLAEVRELEAKGYSIKDIKEYVAQSGNSQELDSVRSKREAAELQQKVQTLSEKAELDEHLINNPKHKTFAKALQGLKRGSPNKSYDQLYVENFSQVPIAKPKVKVETGRGSADEPISETISNEKFNKFPLDEQRAYLNKHGGLFPKGGSL